MMTKSHDANMSPGLSELKFILKWNFVKALSKINDIVWKDIGWSYVLIMNEFDRQFVPKPTA